jgi:hypothetical protein
MRCQGRQKLYRTNAEAIRPLHEWAGTFERYWQHQLNRVKERAEQTVRRDAHELNSQKPDNSNPPNSEPAAPEPTNFAPTETQPIEKEKS